MHYFSCITYNLAYRKYTRKWCGPSIIKLLFQFRFFLLYLIFLGNFAGCSPDNPC